MLTDADVCRCIRLGVVQTEAILYGEYSILTGTCHGGTQVTPSLYTHY